MLLQPKRIAVVGASNKLDSVGARFVRPLLRHGFDGSVVIVHPSEAEVLGLRAVPTLADAGPLDFVTIAVAGAAVEDLAVAAAESGAKFIHVFAGGFAETGTLEGREAEDRIVAAVAPYGARIIGPNCMGVHRPSMRWTFRDDLPLRGGSLGLISQSGGVAIAAIRHAAASDGGFSAALSLGNCADFGVADALRLLADDSETHAISVYVESMGSGLVEAVETVARLKPIAIWPAGMTSAASSAAKAHTAAHGGPVAVDDLAAAGATVVCDLDSLLDRSLEAGSSTARQRKGVGATGGLSIAVASISGGVSVIVAEALERAGFSVPEFGVATRASIGNAGGGLMANAANPVDLGGGYLARGRISAVVEAIVSDTSVDQVALHLALDYLDEVEQRHPGYLMSWIDSVVTAMGNDTSNVTMFIWPAGVSESEGEVRHRLSTAGVHVVGSIDELVDALSQPPSGV